MKKLNNMQIALLILLAQVVASVYQQASDSHTSVPDSGTAKIRTKSFTRSHDSATVQMQIGQNGWLEMDFGNTSNCTDTTAGICDSTSAGQVFDARTSSGTSNVISVNGATNYANYLAIRCECDDSDIDFSIRPVYVHKNATAFDAFGASITFDNTIGVTGTTLESGFRQNDLKIIETLGAKDIKLALTINAGAAPQISCWFSRL